MSAPRVLVVEDNAANQLLASSVLERDGFEVAVATSADEALVAVAAGRPDVILMDLELPGVDGLSLTRLVKADASTAHIAIVAVTARAMTGDREAAMAAGCSGYIAKPIDTRTLSVLVRAFIEAAAAGAGT